MNNLILQAIKKAGKMRTKLGLSMFDPVNIFDACATLGISVRFIDVSMEGMYVSQEDADTPTILISSLRPLPRRVFTCAHELGHHIFGHGSKVDGLTEKAASESFYDNEECLVDAFAGAFLMPIAGVEAEFIKRKWELQNATALQFYTISSVFATGYSTLISHCRANRMITEAKAIALQKEKPGKLLQQIIGVSFPVSHFKIIDNHTRVSVVDLEVGNYLFLPLDFYVEGNHLRKLKNTELGDVYIAELPGITRAVSAKSDISYFIRIQNARYIGLAENRHLEDKVD